MCVFRNGSVSFISYATFLASFFVWFMDNKKTNSLHEKC